MSDRGTWDIVTAVILPLAESFEAASKAAYPAGSVSSFTLDKALIHAHYEQGRRLLEFFISPAYARVFQRTVEGPIIRFRRLENKVPFKRPENWEQEYIDEYNEIWEAVDRAADYLRQLAWMIKSKREVRKQELKAKGKVQVTYAHQMLPLERPAVTRRKKMGEKVLAIIDDCIKRERTPMQCLMRELKSIAHDRWLDDLKVDFPEIQTYGDVADRENPAHVDMFDRFKKVYYRRRDFLKAQGLLKTQKEPSASNPA
jgi:hypothetical protein